MDKTLDVPVKWSRFGGYEVSSKGDRRFSAFYARMPDGRSIEEHYQCDVKGYDPGGRNWRLGKGKAPLGNFSGNTLWQAYLGLWKIWAQNHAAELEELRVLAGKHNNLLSDHFALTSINQAHALATILNERLVSSLDEQCQESA